VSQNYADGKKRGVKRDKAARGTSRTPGGYTNSFEEEERKKKGGDTIKIKKGVHQGGVNTT